LAVALLGLQSLVMSSAMAQAWPNKAVRLIVSSAPGGPGDLVARGFAQAMSNALGQAFVVENRVGADGLIAGEACARATPDGYTLCSLDGFVVVTNPAVRAKMPFDTAKDIDPVVHLGMLAGGLLAIPSLRLLRPHCGRYLCSLFAQNVMCSAWMLVGMTAGGLWLVRIQTQSSGSTVAGMLGGMFVGMTWGMVGSVALYRFIFQLRRTHVPEFGEKS
jgi:hypothetical protein